MYHCKYKTLIVVESSSKDASGKSVSQIINRNICILNTFIKIDYTH